MYQLVLFIHVVIAVVIIGLILMQQGKGATIGASFGSGASQTVFGSTGAGSFLLKLTGLFALAFFTTSLVLGHLAATDVEQAQNIAIPVQAPAPTGTPVVPLNEIQKELPNNK